ncbi:Agenet domain-containing protein [Euphorbia peplus]|nr:Agenet domain-containing protein [Euphorbia peplus]
MSPKARSKGKPRGRTPATAERGGGGGEKPEYLSNESKVEVSSDEEGFKGAWFKAKIVTNSNNKHKKRNQVFVEYEDLLASDSNPNVALIEAMDTSFIRPVPPPPQSDQKYEVYDVVDAFHRDGWWKGVVSNVEVLKDDIRRYIVVFETPPERISFRGLDLRFHLDWSHGQWLGPHKQMRMNGLQIAKGMDVEVNFDRENLEDAWSPATVTDEVGFNSFEVEYDHNHSKETIDSFHIRIRPPKLVVEKFNILEGVDAYHDSCWKMATIQKILTDGRYCVLLKSEDKEIELRQSDIRPHLHLTNGKWTSLSYREIPDGALCEEQSALIDNTAKHSEGKSSVKKLRKKSTPLSKSPNSNKLNKTPPESEETLASDSRKSASSLSPEDFHPISTLIKSSNRLSPGNSHPVSTVMKSAEEVTGSLSDQGANLPVVGSSSRNKGMNIDSKQQEQEAGHESGKAMSSKRKSPEEDGQKENGKVVSSKRQSPQEGRQEKGKAMLSKRQITRCPQEAGQESRKEEFLKRQRPEKAGEENGNATSAKRRSPQSRQEAGNEIGKAIVDSVMSEQVPAADKQNTDSAETTNQILYMNNGISHTRLPTFSGPYAENSSHLPHEELDIQKESKDKGEEHNVSEGTASKMDTEVCVDHTTEVGASCDTVNGDLALSTCLPNHTTNVKVGASCDIVNGDDLPLSPCLGRDVQASSQLLVQEQQELPFAKTASLWQHVESLQVFKWLPQKPHFSPLLKHVEEVREGFAIGNMLNFACLVDNTLKLTIDKPTSVFDGYSKALSDLEMHGFDVKPVVDRINKLLAIKIREEEVKNQSKDLDSEIAEYDSERGKLGEEMNALEERIRELEEQHAMKMVEKVTKDSESNRLKKNANKLKEELLDMKLDFETEVGAPW